MKDKSKYVAIVLALLAVIVLVIELLKDKKTEIVKEGEPVIVSNYSNFYTVNSCLYRAITYAAAKESDNLLLLLNDDYEKENKVTSNNVLELFEGVNESSTFVSKKMYYVSLNEELTKYYVKGYIQQNVIHQDTGLNKSDDKLVYYVVYLDSYNNIFSIEPYDGEIFEKGDTNEG